MALGGGFAMKQRTWILTLLVSCLAALSRVPAAMPPLELRCVLDQPYKGLAPNRGATPMFLSVDVESRIVVSRDERRIPEARVKTMELAVSGDDLGWKEEWEAPYFMFNYSKLNRSTLILTESWGDLGRPPRETRTWTCAKTAP
jgi:hypothetical protein